MVPDHIRQLVAGQGFSFQPNGEFTPKGFDEAVALFSVVCGVEATTSAASTPR